MNDPVKTLEDTFQSYGVESKEWLAAFEARAEILQLREKLKGMEPVGSHHGAPDLTLHDIELLEAQDLWIRTAIEAAKLTGKRGYTENWRPHHPDWIKSRLFWRIRSGKKPLKYPPPTSYSCPWYELIEMPEISHSTSEELRFFDWKKGQRRCSVSQCPYEIISGPEENPTQENPMILKYGKYRFKAWNGDVEWRGVMANKEPYSVFSPGSHIQFDGEIE